MWKYLAVVRDSFREALASRVLWLLLVGITLLLLAILPMSYREVVTIDLTMRDMRRQEDFLILLRTEGPARPDAPVGHVWQGLKEKTRGRLERVKVPGRDKDATLPFEFLDLTGTLRQELNSQLRSDDFYDPEVWQDVPVNSPEARVLQKRYEDQATGGEPLTASERARFHRLMLETAFPEFIRTSLPTSTQFVYATFDVGSAQAFSGLQVRDAIRRSAATVLNFFVGAIGIFVAILVTAPIIPQMFDSGSLHLLLSKPVTRSLLFLAKYLGGCAFILICASYLIGGLWVILGVRFSVWEPRLLYSIPIYLFVFAIYYAVSSLAAVVWRSPIVSIAVSVLFWVACFVIGSVHSVAENMLLSKDRLVKVFWAGESLIGIDELGWGYAWQAESREWKDVFVMPDQRQARPFLLLQPTVPRAFRAVGPVYDAEHDRLLAAVPTFPPSTVRLAVGQRAEQWQPASNLAAPTGTLALLREPRGSILLASSLGLSRLTGNPLAERQSLTLFGLNLPLPGGGPFQSVNPEPAVLLTPPADVALDPQTGAVIVYTRGVLHRLVLETPRAGLASVAAGTPQFVRSAEYRLDGSERQAAVVAMGAQHVAVGREDGRVQILDAATLTPREEFRPEGPNAPRFLDVSPDGRWFSIVFHTGRLWLYDTMDNRLVRADVTGQGDISAASFTTEGKLLVVDRLQRVSEYTLDSLALQRRFEPRPGLVLSVYRYVVVPLYTVFPKPGELDKTFQYLLSGQTTAQVDEEGDDLTTARWNMDPWIPVWSSAAFTLAVLLVACGYIEYQDF